LRSFDHALLASGAAAALLAGAATAKLGLAPLHPAVVADVAPALDSETPAAASERIEADLPSASLAPPPAVIVPVSARTSAERPLARADESASTADRDPRQADDGDAREYVARDAGPEVGDGSEIDAEARPERRPDARDFEQDRDPPIPAADPPAADPPPPAPD
jgi:hypothetical protein